MRTRQGPSTCQGESILGNSDMSSGLEGDVGAEVGDLGWNMLPYSALVPPWVLHRDCPDTQVALCCGANLSTSMQQMHCQCNHTAIQAHCRCRTTTVRTRARRANLGAKHPLPTSHRPPATPDRPERSIASTSAGCTKYRLNPSSIRPTPANVTSPPSNGSMINAPIARKRRWGPSRAEIASHGPSRSETASC